MNGFNWNAALFFERLVAANRFAAENGYRYHLVSGLEGFHGALTNALKTLAFVCVSDTSDGLLELQNTPHARRIKTVFMARRVATADEQAREAAFDNMRELFRQMMSVLMLERTRLREKCVYIDAQVSFKEIERYFYTNCACAYFQIEVVTFSDISFNPEEWTDPDFINLYGNE